MKYRKKPVVIEAVQWDGSAECLVNIISFTNGIARLPLETAKLTIPTLEGDMTAEVNDWIIKGVNGEFYPCKPNIFDKTYSPADQPNQGEQEEQDELRNEIESEVKKGKALYLVLGRYHITRRLG